MIPPEVYFIKTCKSRRGTRLTLSGVQFAAKLDYLCTPEQALKATALRHADGRPFNLIPVHDGGWQLVISSKSDVLLQELWTAAMALAEWASVAENNGHITGGSRKDIRERCDRVYALHRQLVQEAEAARAASQTKEGSGA